MGGMDRMQEVYAVSAYMQYMQRKFKNASKGPEIMSVNSQIQSLTLAILDMPVPGYPPLLSIGALS